MVPPHRKEVTGIIGCKREIEQQRRGVVEGVVGAQVLAPAGDQHCIDRCKKALDLCWRRVVGDGHRASPSRLHKLDVGGRDVGLVGRRRAARLR